MNCLDVHANHSHVLDLTRSLTVNEWLLSAISGHSDRSQHLHSERLLSGKRTFVNVNDVLLHPLGEIRA